MKGTGTQVLSSEYLQNFINHTKDYCNSPYSLMEFIATIHHIKQNYKFCNCLQNIMILVYNRFIHEIIEERTRELNFTEPSTVDNAVTRESLKYVREFLYYTRVIPNLQYLQSIMDEYNINYQKEFNDILERETFTLESLSENIILDDIFDKRYKQPTLE